MEPYEERLVLAIARQIRVELTDRDMNQQDLANAVGVERATMSRYLNGKPMPMPTFFRVAEALRLSPQALMQRAESRISQ